MGSTAFTFISKVLLRFTFLEFIISVTFITGQITLSNVFFYGGMVPPTMFMLSGLFCAFYLILSVLKRDVFVFGSINSISRSFMTRSSVGGWVEKRLLPVPDPTAGLTM